MKTTTIVLIMVLSAFGIVQAGGILTNTNQSADFIRTLNRDASTDVDAVYYNPAGLTMLNDGIHLYVSNQTIIQGREIISNVGTLNNDTFEGKTFVPAYPNIYLAYKMNKLVFSGGFAPIGGGGSAEFDNGLPTFEVPVSALPTTLAAAGASAYRLDVEFTGSSTYLGFQGGVSYKVNDMISIGIGGRYVTAKNNYEGSLKNIEVNFAQGGWMPPGTFMHGVAAQYTAGAASAQAGSDGLQPLIDGGAGDFSFSNLVLAGQLRQGQVDTIGAGLIQLGFTFDPTTSTPAVAQASYAGAAANLTATAAGYEGQANALDAATADIEVDAEQTGSGFAPIVSLNLTPMKGLNIGIRYEGLTALELENNTTVDGSGLFPDGEKTHDDMPALLAVGASYSISTKLRVETSYHYYFNKDVDWDGKEEFLDNGTEMGLALEYSVSNALAVSFGVLSGISGAKDEYHSDLSYSLNSNTVGFGLKYVLSPKMTLGLGVANTMYEDGNNVDETETYKKESLDIAVGFQYSL